jgi:hypothetical protein
MSSTPEPDHPRIEVVEEVEAVPVPVRVEKRIAFLAEHLGLSRQEVAGKLLSMVFREGLDWEDIEYLRELTAGVTSEPPEPMERGTP